MNGYQDMQAASDESLRLDASEIAPMLGLTPERLMAELRAGEVYHAAEEPDAERDGRLLITFRYRARIARLIIEADGTVHPESRLTH